MYYAHIREDGAKQTVEEHLEGTAERCAGFAAAFGEEKRGELFDTVGALECASR